MHYVTINLAIYPLREPKNLSQSEYAVFALKQ